MTDPSPRPPRQEPESGTATPRTPNTTERGWVIGRLWGVPIVLAPSWFIVLIVITAVFGPIVDRQGPELGVWSYAVAAAFAVLLYASVLVHELGHVAVARSFGMPVRRVTLHLLGGVSELEGQMPTPMREFLVAAAGPLLSLALGVLGWLSVITLDPSGAVRIVLVQLTAANLLVGVFNLLPGLPLDGGRVVRAAVWGATGRPITATRVAGWAGRAIAGLAFAFPFLLSPGNAPSLPSVAWGAMISAFIWVGASQSLAAANHEERIPHLSARSLARRAYPVHAGTPLALALDGLTDAGARAMVVVDSDDKPVALASEAAVSAVPIERRPWVDVGAVSRRIASDMVLPVDTAGDQLLGLMSTTDYDNYLVIDDQGRIFGVLAAEDVVAALKGKGLPKS